MLGVAHDKIILLSTLFPTIPMFGKNCCCDEILCSMLGKNNVLYCIVSYRILSYFILLYLLYCIVLYCIVLYCIVSQNRS